MTELYRIRALKFVEDDDGNLTADSPLGQYVANEDGDGLYLWYFEEHCWSTYPIEPDPRAPASHIMSREDGIAACNAHNAEVIRRGLERVPTFFSPSIVAGKTRQLVAGDDPPIDIHMDAAPGKMWLVVAHQVDDPRGESLIESEANHD
jgi:hypothetical protein